MSQIHVTTVKIERIYKQREPRLEKTSFLGLLTGSDIKQAVQLIGCRGSIKRIFKKKVCFSRISRLKVTYMFMALTNSLVVLFIAVLLQIF